VIRPALRSVVGVADVNALGGKVRSFEVLPDPVKLSAVGLSTAQIKAAIEAGESLALKCDRVEFSTRNEPFNFLGARVRRPAAAMEHERSQRAR
jgi:hypothetical protein